MVIEYVDVFPTDYISKRVKDLVIDISDTDSFTYVRIRENGGDDRRNTLFRFTESVRHLDTRVIAYMLKDKYLFDYVIKAIIDLVVVIRMLNGIPIKHDL